MNRLSDFISSSHIDEKVKPMPLIHTTSAFGLRNILDDMALKPVPDMIFGEELLYLFYGKPAYFPKIRSAVNLAFHAPVFFICDPKLITASRRCFPFDSGALVAGRFNAYVHHNMSASDFEIDIDAGHSGGAPFPLSPQKLVSTFYGSNRNYYYGKPRGDVEIGALDFEARVCFELISSKEANDFDERASIIELQVSKKVPLDTGGLIALMLPQEMMSDRQFREVLKKFPDTEIMTYTMYRSKPEYYAALAVERIGQLLESKEYI
jgi:hypothetical protein